MKRPLILSASFVKRVNQPGRYGDNRGGHGLSLLVARRKNGRIYKRWTQRVRIDGRYTNLGLGVYPAVSLAEARRRALHNRQEIEEGRHPRRSRVPTFRAATEKVIGLNRPQWRAGGRTEEHWRSSLNTYAPALARKRIDQITSADILACLAPIWHEKPEMARKVKRRISAVMAWAVAQNHRPDNPAESVAAALGSNTNGGPKHFRALPHSEVAGALAVVDATKAHWSTKAAFRFLTLTATRSGEVRGARWAEIDWEEAVWTIPAERTKTGKPFRVALSAAALAVLSEALPHADLTGLIFRSARGKPLSNMTLSKLCKSNGIACVPHGMRSSFRDWASESGVRREVAEAALSHVVGGVEGAYHRTDLLEARREVMEAWGRYCSGG